MAAPDAHAEVPATLFQALETGATAVTPTLAAATRLRNRFDRTMLAQGRTHWRPADVLPVESWLARQWQSLLIDGRVAEPLLNPAQEAMLWSASIAEHQHGLEAGALDTLAGLAADAWRSLWLAEGQQRLHECGQSRDGQAFLRWVRSFERRLVLDRRVAPAQLPAKLQTVSSAKSLESRELWLVDCDALEPAHRSLFLWLRERGCHLHWLRTDTPGSAQLLPAADEDAELLACASWLRAALRERPGVRIAVVVPGLADRRAEIDRVFRAQLTSPGLAGHARFTFSLGQPLGSFGVAVCALALLRWRLLPLSLEEISRLLRSPYLVQAGDPRLAAAEFDAFELRPRMRLRPELSLDATVAAVERSRRKPRLLNLLYRLRKLRDAGSAGKPADSFAGWSDGFRDALDQAGCIPGSDASTAELGAWRAWESTLDELAPLDDGARHTASEALDTLARLVRSRTVASPNQGEAAIEILQPSELGGAAFDALWFLGADDSAWPAPARPQPLLPWRLQRDLGLPGADRERDLRLAREQTQRILGAASEVVFSYAERGDDAERRLSPLVTELTLPALADAPQPEPHLALAFDAIADTPLVPPVSGDTPVTGGARILELEAACSFRAFAELRLWSTGIEPREPGMDARDRGVAVHTIMEEFWRRVVDQQTLKQLDSARRTEILDECITLGLKRAEELVESRWDGAYMHVQRQRLHALLGAWLDFELTRPAFAVLQQETSLKDVSLGGLTLAELRADRIDETEGGLLLLDYKTGEANPSAWRGTRPEQPQLPLYATVLAQRKLYEEPLAGVAFGLLRAGEGLKLTGIADDPRVLRKSARMEEPSFAEQVDRWTVTLAQLADSFRDGPIQVNPKSYPGTCDFCDQRLFCRLDPARLTFEEQDPEPETAVDG